MFPRGGARHQLRLLQEAVRRAQHIISISKSLPHNLRAMDRLKINGQTENQWTSSVWLLAGKRMHRISFDLSLKNDSQQSILKKFISYDIHNFKRDCKTSQIPKQSCLPSLKTLYNGSNSQTRENPCSPTYNCLRSVP